MLCVENFMFAIYQIVPLVGDYKLSFEANSTSKLVIIELILFALIWLLHNDVRESIKKLVTCTPCRKGGPEPTEHELRSDVA